MKGLATLIKLHKRTLDELRRKMVALENQKRQLEQAVARLRQELDNEMKLASHQPEMAHFFGDFARRIRKRQDKIGEEIRAVEAQMGALADEIAAAYAEVKKFEIAQENARRRVEDEERRKETVAMDEIAGQQFSRKKEGQ